MTQRRLRLAVLLAALAAAVIPAGPVSAAVAVLGPDTVSQIPDPGVALAVPADGRVNGYQFAAKVLGAATGTSMPAPNGARAGVGQRLWVFGLRWSADQTLDGTGQPNGVARVTATLTYNAARLPVPLQQPAQPSSGSQPVDSGAEYFLASLPANTPDVTLELANGGYAQDFSLTHMAREGAQPAVLYRSPDSWQVTQPLTLSKSLPTPYTQSANVDTSNLLTASMTLQLNGMTLSYFAPDGPADTPADPSKAWLIPDLEDPVPHFTSAFENLNYTTHAQASGITLTLPDGTVLPAKDFPGAGPDGTQTGFDNNNVFVDRFAFEVPATLTAATITIALPPEVAYPDYGFTAPSQTYNLTPVKFAFTLPAQQPVSPPTGASNRPAAIRAIGANTPSRNSSSSIALPIILALVACAAVAGPVLLRRRRVTNTAATAEPGVPPAPPGPPFEAAGTAAPPAGSDPVDAATSRVGTATLVRPGPTDLDGQEGTGHPAAPVGAVSAVGGVHLGGSDPLDGYTPPAAPALGEPAVIVFGPKAGVVGWAERPDRSAVAEIVFYLATHPGHPVSAETLQAAVGSEVFDPEHRTLRSNISRARRALGDGHLPGATNAGGYQLNDVACDLALMEQLAVQAASAERPGDLNAAVGLYGQAVALITGRPFESGPGYSWVDLENLRTYAERTATTAASNLARLALQVDQPLLALWAARQGLLVDPLNQALAAPAIIAAKRCGKNPAVRAQWTSITRVLEAHEMEPDADLIELYHRLLDEPDD